MIVRISRAKHIKNSIIFEHYQRNKISVCLKKYDDDDIILISDLDEIPNLKVLIR